MEVRELLTVLAPEELCALTRTPTELLRPVHSNGDEAWLQGVLEFLAGQRSWDERIAGAIRMNRVDEALRLCTRASDARVRLSAETEDMLDSAWQELVKNNHTQVQKASHSLREVPKEATSTRTQLQSYEQLLDEVRLGPLRPKSFDEMESALLARDRAAELALEIEVLAFDAQQEIESNRVRLCDLGSNAFNRIIAELKGQRSIVLDSREAKILRAIPDLILQGRGQLLEMIAETSIAIDDPLLDAEIGTYTRPTSGVSSPRTLSQSDVPLRLGAGTPQLTTLSRQYIDKVKPAVDGLKTFGDLAARLRDQHVQRTAAQPLRFSWVLERRRPRYH